MRAQIITFVMVLGLIPGLISGLSGCINKPAPPEENEPVASPRAVFEPSRPAVNVPEPVRGVITLHEAMARAVKAKYNSRLGMMESELAKTMANPPSFNMLPEIIRSAGYNPGGMQTQGYDNIAMWNILDYGLSFAAYSQNQGKSIESVKRKVLQNIIQEVRNTYYRAASAQSLLDQCNELSKQVREALDKDNESYGRNSQQSMKIYEDKRKLIENVRVLWESAQKMTSAKSELALLMNLPPGTRFRIYEPNWNAPEFAHFKQSMTGMDMEYMSLANRTEINETGFKTNAGVYETRKAILKMHPGLNFDSGYNSATNSFVYSKGWMDAGLQVSKTLFDLISGSQASHSVIGGEYSRGLALNMAITTQLHLARQQYAMAKEMYSLSGILQDPGRKFSGFRKGISALKKESDDMISRIRFHQAFADIEIAADRLYNSFGITALPADIDSAGLPGLTASLKKSLDRRERLLSQVKLDQIQTNRLTGNRIKENQVNENRVVENRVIENRAYAEQVKPGMKSQENKPPFPLTSPKQETIKPQQPLAKKPENFPAIKKSNPLPDEMQSDPYVFKSKNNVEVNISAAEKKGQNPVREILVFRDVVNIHFGPSTKSSIKGQGLIGERYKLLGWSPKGWLKIEMSDGSPGWIPTKFAKPVENENTGKRIVKPGKPVIKIKPKPRQAPKPAKKIIATTKRANIRAGAGFNKKVIYIAPKGSRFKVHGTSGEWFEIRTKRGFRAWVHDSTVKVLSRN